MLHGAKLELPRPLRAIEFLDRCAMTARCSLVLSPTPGEQAAAANTRIARKKVHQRPTAPTTSLVQSIDGGVVHKETQQESLTQ